MPPRMRILPPGGVQQQFFSVPADGFSTTINVSDVTLTGGSSIAPPAGTRVDLGTDVLLTHSAFTPLGGYTANGGTGGLTDIVVWTGMAFASGYGAKGSILFTGGGHDSYAGNEVYAFDLASKTWNWITVPGHPIYRDSNNRVADYPEGEMWTDGTFTVTSQQQPAASHVIDGMVYVPPNIGGGGANGMLVSVARPAIAYSASSVGQRTHYLDLSTSAPHTWNRFSTNRMDGVGTPARFPTATCAPQRNAIYAAADSATGGSGITSFLYVLPFSTKTWISLPLSTSITCAYHQNLRYMEADDLLMYYYNNGAGSTQFRVIDPTSGQVYSPGTTGTGPAGWGGGEWIESRRQYVFYEGNAGSTLYWLTPPSSPTTSPWTWVAETITGPTPKRSFAGWQHYSRMRWAPSEQTLLWFADPAYPVQAWTPR